MGRVKGIVSPMEQHGPSEPNELQTVQETKKFMGDSWFCFVEPHQLQTTMSHHFPCSCPSLVLTLNLACIQMIVYLGTGLLEINTWNVHPSFTKA